MSGGASAATVAAILGAGAATGGTIYGIVNGQQQKDVQQKTLARQNQAQQKAEASALSTERKSELAQNEVNQKTPDITAILQRAAALNSSGISSTMLTGPAGVNANKLSLGKSTLLGS